MQKGSMLAIAMIGPDLLCRVSFHVGSSSAFGLGRAGFSALPASAFVESSAFARGCCGTSEGVASWVMGSLDPPRLKSPRFVGISCEKPKIFGFTKKDPEDVTMWEKEGAQVRKQLCKPIEACQRTSKPLHGLEHFGT